MQEGYRLHAVLVHEGQVSSGHYWAFIRDQWKTGEEEEDEDPHSGWMKFNDVQVGPSFLSPDAGLTKIGVRSQVSRCGWKAVVEDAFGGEGSTASAYCLVYVALAHAHRIFHPKSIPLFHRDEQSGMAHMSRLNHDSLREIPAHGRVEERKSSV